MKKILLPLLLSIIGTVSAGFVYAQAEQTTFVVTPVKNQLHLLQGKGGNILASLGNDGLLIIDDDFTENGKALEDALQVLAGDIPRFIVNTHWHFDHAGSNAYFGERRSVIVAQKNVRKRMSAPHKSAFLKRVSPASPAAALPLVTYDSAMTLHLNGSTIELVHYPQGHTDGDTVVYFSEDNVVHMGDLFFNPYFPFVDISSGGNVLSYRQNVADVLAQIDNDTVVVPGHGPVTDKQGLQVFYDMLLATTEDVKSKLDKGWSLEKIQGKGLGKQWQSWGKGFISEEAWIAFIVESIESVEGTEVPSEKLKIGELLCGSYYWRCWSAFV